MPVPHHNPDTDVWPQALFSFVNLKNTRPGLIPGRFVMFSLQELNVFGLQTFGSFYDVELHRRTLLETLKAGRLDGGEMDENVLSTGAAQKAVSLRVVKPLHCSLFHCVLPCFVEISC